MKEHLDERAMKQYTEMLIEQLQQMKESNWEKPWFSSKSFITPQNINGRPYSGSNVLMLMFHKQKHDYQLPVYMTWQQAGNMGLAINKGEKSFPISLWNRIIKDENGKRISEQEYNNLSESEQEKCKVIPLQKYFNVFNVEQSNIKTAKPELWDALVKKLQTPAKQMDESNMVKNPALDKMLEDQSWICHIYQEPDSDKACFHKGNDEIFVPEKKQFIDGESFYGTLLHEMIHSTGTKERLNRDMSGYFGSVPYAREELVAELGSAMAAINFGINKSIKDESREYIKSWLDAMQQDPKFLMSVIGDIAKAVDFVNKNTPKIEVAENLEEQQPLEAEQSRQEQLNSEEKTEIREKTDVELDNEAYERESEAIDSGHKAHFIAAWKEGEPNNGTFYEVWLKDEDITNEDGVDKYRDIPLWNIQDVKEMFNIADTFYNKEEIEAAWDEKFAGLSKETRVSISQENKIQPDIKEYSYQLSIRPFGIGTQPDGHLRHEEDGSRYGVVIYDHPLSKGEVENFSLRPISEALEQNGRSWEVPFGNDMLTIRVENVDSNGSIHYIINEEFRDATSYHAFMSRLGENAREILPEEQILKKLSSGEMLLSDAGNELENQISTASDEEPQVKTLEESLRDKLYKGEMTLHDAGAALNKAGKVNYIPDAKETMEVLNKHLEFVTKSGLLSEDGPFKVDEKALMAAVNVGIDVSLRDFAIDMPPTDRRIAMGLASFVLSSKNEAQLKEGLRLNNYAHSDKHVEALWSLRQAFNEKTIDLSQMVKNIQESFKTGQKENVEEKAEVKETEQSSGEGKEESRLDLFQKVVDDTLQGKHVNMPYEVYELLESMTDSELQQAKAIAEKRKGRSNMVKANMGDIRIKVEQQIMTRADDRNPEQAEKRGYEKTIKSMRESGTLFMARFDFESYIRRQKTDEEMMVQKNHPGAAAAHQGAIRAAQEYEKILDSKIEMLNKDLLQHDKLKEKHPDSILFLRTGNNYMIMKEGAQAVSQVTDLQLKRYPLTKGEKPKEVLAVEFPVSKLDTYLPQMVRAGKRVAICDGIDTPKISKRQEQTDKLPEAEEQKPEEKAAESAENRQQQGYKDTIAFFNDHTGEYLKDFNFDHYINEHKEAAAFYEQHGKPLEAAYETGSIQAAEEMKAKYIQSAGEKATQEAAPKLKYFYSGNGISLSEEGDKNYTAFITQDREIKLYKEFHPDNLQKIKQMAETGNMLFRNGNASSDKGYLVLDPVNKPSKIYENPATMDRYFLSIEHVDGKELATIGRSVFIDEKEKIDKLMDYTPENMAILEKKADDLLETKTQELKNAFRGGDSATIQSASYSYMWASKYKLQQYYNPSKCKEEIKKIQDSIILQKDNKMETTEKKEMKDGISVFKMQNGQYGINETKDGVRTPTRRLHEEDVKAYFEGLKGQPKEEVNRRREVLAEKYLRGNQQAQLAEQTPKKQLEPLSPEHRERLTNASVFKMQDGVSYGVRTQIDGQQHSAKRVKREDIAAFFDGYKGLPKEQQDERKAQLAGMYFKEELTTPKQELSHGMHR